MIWYDAFSELWSSLELLPSPSMALDGRLNALMRLAVVATAVLLVGLGDVRATYLLIAAVLLTAALWETRWARAAAAAEGFVSGGVRGPCTPPTREDPTMNAAGRGPEERAEAPPGCDPTDPRVSAAIDASLEEAGFVAGSDDMINRRLNLRSYHTVPGAKGPVPDRREEFITSMFPDLGRATRKEAGIDPVVHEGFGDEGRASVFGGGDGMMTTTTAHAR